MRKNHAEISNGSARKTSIIPVTLPVKEMCRPEVLRYHFRPMAAKPKVMYLRKPAPLEWASDPVPCIA